MRELGVGWDGEFLKYKMDRENGERSFTCRCFPLCLGQEGHLFV